MPLPSNPPGFYRSATADGEPSCEDFWTLVVTPFGRRGIGLHHHRCIRTHTVIHLEVSILLPFLPLSAKRGGEKSFPFPFPSPPFLSALFFFRARSNYIAERWSSAKRGKKLPKKKMLHFATCGGNLVTLRRFCKKKKSNVVSGLGFDRRLALHLCALRIFHLSPSAREGKS